MIIQVRTWDTVLIWELGAILKLRTMAQKSDANLTTQANVIKNETDTGDNTATRVGQMFVDDIDSKINIDKIVDEDNMASDSATLLPTQQSVKAYVDAVATAFSGKEDASNKATNFGTLNDTLYPSVQAVETRILAATAGLKWKASVRIATTVAGTFASSFENGDTVDGVVLATGNRILLKNQADQTTNGIYTVNASGSPTRATDADSASELEGAAVSVQEGTSNANTTWLQTTDSITLGSSNIVFSTFGTSVADADASTKGIAKLYTSLGSNTDGSIDQNTANTNFALKANLASPTFTGVPLAPTASADTNNTQIATTAYADAKVADTITNGQTTKAPSQNAVFDALALKADLASSITNGDTTHSPDGNSVFDALALKQDLVNSAATITDSSTMDIAAMKNTLATSSSTRTFTISYTGDDITMQVTLSATASTFTFPAAALCVSEGIASGDNTCPLDGVSGDKYIFAIKKIGSAYYVVAKNFGQ